MSRDTLRIDRNAKNLALQKEIEERGMICRSPSKILVKILVEKVRGVKRRKYSSEHHGLNLRGSKGWARSLSVGDRGENAHKDMRGSTFHQYQARDLHRV